MIEFADSDRAWCNCWSLLRRVWRADTDSVCVLLQTVQKGTPLYNSATFGTLTRVPSHGPASTHRVREEELPPVLDPATSWRRWASRCICMEGLLLLVLQVWMGSI